MQDTRSSHRFGVAVRSTARAFLVLLACSWLLLHLDSIHQRRKAERLFEDLRSFPFATAGFAEVRGLTNRYGGSAVQQFPGLEFPHYGLPLVDSTGQVHVPPIQVGPFSCTVRDCVFEISIRTRLAWLPSQGWRGERLYEVLQCLGIRPWVVYANFEVREGKLKRSRTAVGYLRSDRLGRYDGLIPFGYEIVSVTDPRSLEGSDDYTVSFTHVMGSPADILIARFLQTPEAPIRRAFDLNLHCLTTLLHGCGGFDELAPSAWSDYEAREAKLGEEGHHP